MEVITEFLFSIVQWVFKNLISIFAVLIAFLAYCQSKSANKIAEEANQLVKNDISYAKERDK